MSSACTYMAFTSRAAHWGLYQPTGKSRSCHHSEDDNLSLRDTRTHLRLTPSLGKKLPYFWLLPFSLNQKFLPFLGEKRDILQSDGPRTVALPGTRSPCDLARDSEEGLPAVGASQPLVKAHLGLGLREHVSVGEHFWDSLCRSN